MHGADAGCKPHRGSHRRGSLSQCGGSSLANGGAIPMLARETNVGHGMPKLFSYGTLQQEDVQLATFGRRLSGVSDALVGYRQSVVAIQDPEVVRTSGKTHHPIVAFTGKREDCAPGTVFEITDAELAHADAYEVAAYVRVKAPLASGLEAWVYVDARGKPPAA
jgi:hypothetical protein